MKKFSRVAIWAMSLAIASTAAMSAYAEGNEEPTSPDAAITTEAPTEAETDAPTEAETTTEATEAPTDPATTAPPQSGNKSGVIGPLEIRVNSDNSYSMRDVNTNASLTVSANGAANISGTVIVSSEFDGSLDGLTDEQKELFKAFAAAASSIKITSIEYADSVTEVQEDFVDPEMVAYPLTITFGKNVKTINSDFFSGVTGEVTVYGYSGTAAEKYAKDGGAEFVSIGTVLTTTAPAATTAKKTTTAKNTTAKKTTTAATTTKSTDSPKTGDAGTGTVAGVLALAGATFALSMKKRKNK